MQLSIKKIIKEALGEIALKEKWEIERKDLAKFQVYYPSQEKLGDVASNVALVLAKKLQLKPLELAEKIKNNLEEKKEKYYWEKIEVASPGYLNFFYTSQFWQEKIKEINEQGKNFGKSQINQGKEINNEFISANPTGPLHLGNGRGGFLGDVLGRVWRETGAQVTNEYYINDAGEQIVQLGHSILKDEQAVYRGKYIDELSQNVPEKLLTEKNPLIVGEWGAREILTKKIKPSILEKMKIRMDNWVSEKKDIIEGGWREKAFKILKEKKMVYVKEGATWLKTSQWGDEKDRVLIKKDGTYTYFASDCGYILYKKEKDYNQLVEIWGADHHGYVKRLEAVTRALDFQGEMKFILVQLVRLIKNGQEVKMSKRQGNVVYVDNLLKEVGSDVARFFFLMRSANTHMDFDLDLAKEKSDKNPVYYVQYAVARLNSLLKKSKMKNGAVPKVDLSLLTHPKELALIKQLAKFPEILKNVSQSLEAHQLPQYAIAVADRFHSFYANCRVLDEKNKELSQARFQLILATKIVLERTLEIIGVEAPEKM